MGKSVSFFAVKTHDRPDPGHLDRRNGVAGRTEENAFGGVSYGLATGTPFNTSVRIDGSDGFTI
jgi:hypothetical protein